MGDHAHGSGEKFLVQVEFCQNLLEVGFLLRIIVDGEGSPITEQVAVFLEDSETGAVECAHPRKIGYRATGDFLKPSFHFRCRLVGEGDGQDPCGVEREFIDEIGNLVGESSGLATASAGSNDGGARDPPYRGLLNR